jgi:hypothetical protein
MILFFFFDNNNIGSLPDDEEVDVKELEKQRKKEEEKRIASGVAPPTGLKLEEGDTGEGKVSCCCKVPIIYVYTLYDMWMYVMCICCLAYASRNDSCDAGKTNPGEREAPNISCCLKRCTDCL